MDYKGKVAIITGSSRGIGKACAKALLERGTKVCLSGTNADKGKETLAEFQRQYGDDNVIYVKCDVKSDDETKVLFETTMATFKRLDIVVNNAGIVDEIDWKACMETNFDGVIRGTNLAIQYMRSDKGGNGGTIVNMSSIAAFMAVPSSPCYAGIKAGIVTYTRSWSEHPHTVNNGIRLLCLCPGPVATDMEFNLDLSRLLNYEEIGEKSWSTFNVLSLEECAQGFVKLLDDKDNNGSALKNYSLKDQEPRILYEYAAF